MLKGNVNKERVRKWVDSLRSGRWMQGYGLLAPKAPESDNIRCCLGVACEVYREETGLGAWIVGPNGRPWFMSGPEQGSDTGLTPDVLEFFGIHSENGDVFLERVTPTGAQRANDALNWDFFDIANALEREYL